MRKEVIIKQFGNFLVSGLLQDGEFIEFDTKDLNTTSEVGNIYIGKVKNIVPNIHGAFVEIKDKQLCFYPLDERHAEEPLRMEDEILVQIKRDGSSEKKPLVTECMELTGQYLVLTSNKSFVGVSNKIKSKERKNELKSLLQEFVTKDYGFIVRTSGKDATEDELYQEAKKLSAQYEEIKQKAEHRSAFQYIGTNQSEALSLCFGLHKDQIDTLITDDGELAKDFMEQGYQVKELSKEDNALNRGYRMEHYLSQALQKKVWLKSGGFLVIEKTEAMTVIDVNSGKSIGKGKKESHLVAINQEAAREIAKQIRLRNISGIIMVDFIDMKKEDAKESLLSYMRELTRLDSKKVTVVDLTMLGLMEITRKKEKISLFESGVKKVLTE